MNPRDALYASIATGTWPDISPYTDIPLIPRLFDDGLYDWQYDLLCEVAALMRAGYRRVLLQLETGGGKTMLALSALLSARLLGLRAAFLVHRKELLKQTGKRFTSAALDHSFVAAHFPFDPAAGLHLAGVQTLVRRLSKVLPPVFVIVDEAHHACSRTYEEILSEWPDAFILLLTATPERLDGRGLEEHADIMVEGPPPRWLIDNGFLSPYELYAPSMPDFTGVDPDRQKAEAEAVMNRPALIGNVVEHYLELAKGEQGIVFGQGRKHSRALADAFNEAGIPAMHVDGDTSPDERDRFDEEFRAGEILIGCNVDLFAEGYDVPNISYLGDAGRSKSRVKVKQRWGRVLRTAPGKKRGIICDHAGNALPSQFGGQGHGLPDDEYEYSLQGMTRKQREKDWTSITQCMECFRIYPSSASECPGCASERRVQPREIRQKDGKLEKLEREALKQAAAQKRKIEEWSCMSYDEFESLGRARGYRFPMQWARRMCHLRGISDVPDSQARVSTVRAEEWAG